MRAIIQRVREASVQIDGSETRSIGPGQMLLLGIHVDDTEAEADYLARKAAELRIFEDELGRLDRSLIDTGGEMLVVSNFTLYADCKKGRRPSFTAAARPPRATELYEHFLDAVRTQGVTVMSGEFGADMQVRLQNDGPVTIVLDTAEIMPKQEGKR